MDQPTPSFHPSAPQSAQQAPLSATPRSELLWERQKVSQTARCHEAGEEKCKFVVIQTEKSDFSSRARPACRAELATNTAEAQAAAAGWNLGVFPSALAARGFSAGISQFKGRSLLELNTCSAAAKQPRAPGQQPQLQEPFPGRAGRGRLSSSTWRKTIRHKQSSLRDPAPARFQKELETHPSCTNRHPKNLPGIN